MGGALPKDEEKEKNESLEPGERAACRNSGRGDNLPSPSHTPAEYPGRLRAEFSLLWGEIGNQAAVELPVADEKAKGSAAAAK